jgi:hypothetical protein
VLKRVYGKDSPTGRGTSLTCTYSMVLTTVRTPIMVLKDLHVNCMTKDVMAAHFSMIMLAVMYVSISYEMSTLAMN